MYGEEIEKLHTEFWWKRDHFEDPGLDERIILRWVCRNWDGGMD
jgi:hypothetical protein